MKTADEYVYAPDISELTLAAYIAMRVSPTPQFEFIFQPSAFSSLAGYPGQRILRITNTETGATDDYGVAIGKVFPQFLITTITSKDKDPVTGQNLGLGFKEMAVVPPAPQPPPPVNTGFQPLKPGQIMGLFGPVTPILTAPSVA